MKAFTNGISFKSLKDFYSDKEQIGYEDCNANRLIEIYIDAAAIKNKDDFIFETLTKLKCPSYGSNWDSWLSEIRALYWLEEDYITVIFHNMSHVDNDLKSMWDMIISMFINYVFIELVGTYHDCINFEENREAKCLQVIFIEEKYNYGML